MVAENGTRLLAPLFLPFSATGDTRIRVVLDGSPDEYDPVDETERKVTLYPYTPTVYPRARDYS